MGCFRRRGRLPRSPTLEDIEHRVEPPRNRELRITLVEPRLSRSALDVEVDLFDHPLAHDELLDLAGDRHRKLAHEADVLRHVVMSDLVRTETAHGLGVAVLLGPEFDPGTHHLAVAGIRNAKDLRLLHLGMSIEKLLNLTRGDVLSAADDQILHPPDDLAVPLIIEGGQVSGVHPAALIDGFARLLRLIPVAVHHTVSARQKLAPMTARHGLAVSGHDLHFQMRVDRADGRYPPLDRVIAMALKTHRARLGHAVADGDFTHIHLSDHAPHQLHGARRTRHHP